MRKLNTAFHFILLGALAFMATGREDVREEILIHSEELVARKDTWEQAHRITADASVLRHLLDNMIAHEILICEAVNLRFHQTDGVVWSRLIRNMRFASQDQDALDSEELFNQALSLGMHRSDLIVRRRLVARMEQFLKNNYYIDEPDEADIDRFIEDNPDLFSGRHQVSFCHVFINPGSEHHDGDRSAEQLLHKLRKGSLSPEMAYRLGHMFPHPYCFREVTRSYVVNIFGKSFAEDLLTCQPEVWSGPFRSGYGTHLVWLEGIKETGVLDLTENRNRARNHLLSDREKQLTQDVVTELHLKYYTVLIDGEPQKRFPLEQLLDRQAIL